MTCDVEVGTRSWLVLAAAAVATVGGPMAVRLAPDLDHGPWFALVVASGLSSGALTGLAVWTWRHHRVGPVGVGLFVVVGLVARLVLMGEARMLSDDACRYHWDGKVSSAGINPYLYPPDHAAFAPLRTDALDARINHPDVRTVYPPIAQAMFSFAWRLSPGRLLGYQSLALASELVAAALLLWLLAKLSLPLVYGLLLWWSPLAIFEGYLPGHVDTYVLPWIVALVWAVLIRRPILVGLFLACASLIKPFALVFWPAVLSALGHRRGATALATSGFVMAACYLPFVDAGAHLFSSTWLMATAWWFNGSLAHVAGAMLGQDVARTVMAVVLAILLLGSTRARTDLVGRLLLAYAAFVACSTTVMPWYLVTLLPLLALRPDPALVWLSIVALAAETVNIGFRADGTWVLSPWARAFEYLPFYALLAWGYFRRWGIWADRPRDVLSPSRNLAVKT